MVDHEYNEQGLRVVAARELEAAINEQFIMGTLGLAHHDYHYIWRG